MRWSASVLHRDQVEHLADPALRGPFVDPVEVGHELEELTGGEVVVEIGLLGDVADAGEGFLVARRVAEERDLAGVDADEAEEGLDRRGLACTVVAEVGKGFPCVDLEGHVVQDLVFLAGEVC